MRQFELADVMPTRGLHLIASLMNRMWGSALGTFRVDQLVYPDSKMSLTLSI